MHLDSIDSTNEYAKRYFKEIKSKNPFVITAGEQTEGKGQQDKQWNSDKDENILLSFCFPPSLFYQGNFNNKFQLLATIALGCYDFCKSYISQPVFIKWINDIYVKDKKIAGILIENIYQSNEWQWAIAGIGININQSHFPIEKKAISIYQINQKKYTLSTLYLSLI
ncbi:MAG: biotin--[acetyl-CoA-carboxylase] ligase, partial [Chitinophagaceae bacterium]